MAKPGAARPPPLRLSGPDAATFLVGHHGLRAPEHPPGAAGVRALLERLRCIQLDPLEPLGSNADLVALARLDGISLGDVYRFSYPGHAFEHFAKERCLLPASAFPWYRDQAAETPWWRLSERLEKLPPAVIERVLAELRERGPLGAKDLADHGRVEPLVWFGWKSTASATTLALEVLWTRCQIVVCGRGPRGKLYDIPERALPKVARLRTGAPPHSPAAFQRWALLERIEAAGLLSRAGGATWSMLSEARKTGLADQLIEEGAIEEVLVEGSPRPYLAPRGFLQRRHPKSDGRIRLLGPLDALLWDRNLVKQAFGFDYIWEVYKPAALRRWGWYVCPLLQGDKLVARLEGALEGATLRVRKLWGEKGVPLDRDALVAALERHAEACAATRVVVPRRVR